MSNGNKSALYERGTYPTYTQVVEALENKSYYNSNNDSFEDTNLLSKLQEVTNWFNDVAKVSLLRCTDKNKNEEFKFLLLGLKKSVKHAMQSIGKSSMKHGKQFTCSVCNEVITIEPQKDPWDSLQNHEHFEQLYNDYLSGKPIVLRDEVCVVNGYNSSSSNNDRGSVDSSPEIVTNDQSPLFCDISASTGAIRKVPTFTERPKYIENDVEESGLNSFKFNFQLKYDDTIEGLIYPSKLMVDIKKLDGIKENSIQKCGKFKIVCLLCGVNLSSRSKYFVGKHQIVDHISGQKHYKFTAPDSASLKALVKYHDAWHGFDEALQSHQVYFVPSTDVHAKCTLCNYTVVRYAMIETHVHSDEHKKLAIETFLLNQKKKVYSPEILDMQLKGYNVDGASLLAKLKTDHSEEPSARIRATSNGSSSPVTGAIVKVPLQVGATSSKTNQDQTKRNLGASSFKQTDENKLALLGNVEKIENALYPKSLMLSVRTIDGAEEHTIQKCGKYQVFCLLCGVEILNKAKNQIKKYDIISHVSGRKHLKNKSQYSGALSDYHKAWLEFDGKIRSHQVYFLPGGNDLNCKLCNCFVNYGDIESHIRSEEHKVHTIDTFIFNREDKTYFPEIIDIQLKGYNIIIVPQLETNGLQDSKSKKRGTRSSVLENENAPTPKKVEPKVKPPRRKMEHAVSKSMSNPNGTELSDTLPKRFKEHLKYLEKNGLSYRCTCCQVGVGTSADDIKYHISRSNHLETTKTVLKKCNYFCDICDLHIREEAAWSKHFEGVVTKHESMAASRKSRVTEYECNCGLVLYGDEMSIERHLLASNKSDGNKKLIKLPDEVKKLFPSNDRILEHGHKLSLEANSVLNHKDRTYLCCQRLEKVLSDAFPGCKSYPFGSRISGLGNKDSDLDVFIDVGDMYDGQIQQDCRNQINFVRKSTGIFSKFRDEFRQICPIPSARTPIVKLYHAKTGLDCDISFRHGLSVENTKFISYCIKHQPVLQPFVLLLKKWSAFCRFNEDITTYAFAILAIFYMQINGYLLSVEKIRELDPNPRLVIDGWETFNNNLSIASFIKPCVLSPVDLLKGFFQYYSSFNYEQYIICPLLGVPIEKTLFTEDGSKLPHQMKSYVEKINTMEDPEYFRVKSTCCIQDPFDLSHNLTKACQLRIVSKLKILCDLTHKHLLSVK